MKNIDTGNHLNLLVFETIKPISKVDNERAAIVKVLESRRNLDPFSRETIIVKHLEALGLHNKAFTYEQCGELVAKFRCEKCNRIEYIPQNSCNLRICEKCCKKLFYKLWSGYYPKVKLMKNPKLITLTFGFSPMLYPDVVSEFRRMFSKFRKKLKIKSGVYVFEVKRSPARVEQMEVHIHALVDHAYIPQAKTSETWFEISGRPITDIRRAYGVRAGLGYIMKYVLKPPSFPIARDYAEFEFMFNNRRRIQGFGDCCGEKTSLVDMEITCRGCGGKMVKVELTSCYLLENQLRNMVKGVGDG